MSTDWLPGRRDEQLAMAKNWCNIMDKKTTAWGIPQDTVMNLVKLTDIAVQALEKTETPEKSQVDTARCIEAFDQMIEKMRDIKKRHFLQPPLLDSDLVDLGLKPRDIRTPVDTPNGQAEADVSYPGPHLLELHLRPLAETQIDERADHGFRIYWGVLSPGGASVEAAASQERYLLKTPISGEDLPHSRFTRKHKELFEFPAEDSSRTAYFCIRFENSKGDSGPWGPIFSAVIP